MGRPTTPIHSNTAMKEELQALVRSRSMPQAIGLRAQIILLADQGPKNMRIAEHLGVCPVIDDQHHVLKGNPDDRDSGELAMIRHF
jgi:hypothetical protein